MAVECVGRTKPSEGLRIGSIPIAATKLNRRKYARRKTGTS